MAEFPLVVGSGVGYFDGVGLFVGDDGLLYHQDADGNRVSVGAALSGAVAGNEDFIALGHPTPNADGSGGGYGDPTPPIMHGVHAPVYSHGPANTDLMHPGNMAFHLDLANSQVVFTALDDDGNVLTGSVALA